jgi:hypothetical protein
MSITYTKEQREVVKADKSKRLATIAIDGIFSFQGPMPAEQWQLIVKCFEKIAKLKRETK